MSSRSKGARGEREVCKILTDWWKPHYPDAVFVKTPGSGGWGGGSRFHQQIKSDMRASGDVMTSLKEFPFSVEVKRNQSWSLDWLCLGRKSPVWKWWIQAQTQAEKDNLEPMLWFRKNNRPWYVLMPLRFAHHFPLPPPYVAWSRFTLRRIDYGKLLPIMFEGSVLTNVDPTIFEEMV